MARTCERRAFLQTSGGMLESRRIPQLFQGRSTPTGPMNSPC